MITRHKIILWILLLLTCKYVVSDDAEQKDDLVESESKDPGKIEIIKQIKRVNDDGSYTFGYEAEDGTFKIESRDVLGNVKGTFGYVDTDGEIKRVSYSTSNATEASVLSSNERDKSPVIQQIPKNNRTNPTTRRPTLVYPHVTPSPSSTVIQSIPRRRIIVSSNSTTTTEKTTHKNIKSVDFNAKSTESPLRYSRPNYPSVSYARSTPSPHTDGQRYTEGQIIRPIQSDNVTPRPTEHSYLHRLIVTRNPLSDERASSTIKPITEEYPEEPIVARSNLLRRQLSQEKVSNFDPRAHVLTLQQSLGDDAADVYSGSFTTGTPRPLFTTTNKPKYITPAATKTIISPAKYPQPFQKGRPQNDLVQETTTDSTVTDNSYVTPNPVQIVQYSSDDRPRHPYHRGAIFVPYNQFQNGRYIYEEPVDQMEQPRYSHYMVPNDQYIREQPQYVQQIPDGRGTPIPIILRRRPIPRPIDEGEYQRQQVQYIQPRPVPIPIHPADFQDEIDNIRPPVSTRDFQKLLDRLIIRQTHLREINRQEQTRFVQDPYYPDRFRPVQPTPVSLFVRTHQDTRQNNGPVQFLPQSQQSRARGFVSIPSNQKMHEAQYPPDQYGSDYAPAPLYRTGRRVARLLNPRDQHEKDDLLPPDVREMLLLRMLQLAINPNLPLPTGEQEVTAAPSHRKEAVRNVQILGEESEETKPAQRNKRYENSYDDDY